MLSEAATRLQQTTISAVEQAEVSAAAAAQDRAEHLQRVTALTERIDLLDAEVLRLTASNGDLAARESLSLAEADRAVVDARTAREDAAHARADQGRAEAVHATEQAATAAELQRMGAEVTRAQNSEARALELLAQTRQSMQDQATQAQIELEQAATTAYDTGRSEVLDTVPALVEAASQAGQSAGRHAVLNLLDASAGAMAGEPLSMVHSVLADALTDDTLPPGTPALHLENSP